MKKITIPDQVEEALRKIQIVVFNQRPVSQELLDLYEGWPSQFNLLVKILAEAQRAEPSEESFIKFVKDREDAWVEWVLTAKVFRKWLKSTGYSYEYTPRQRLAELFLEHLEDDNT